MTKQSTPRPELSGISLDRLVAFLDVVETGSIAAAARKRDSDPALVSRQMTELASSLGTPLFRAGDRTERKLTPAGRQLASTVRDLLSGLEAVRRAEMPGDELLTVGSADSIAAWLLLPLAGTRTLGDKLRLRIATLDDGLHEVESGACDVALLRHDGPWPESLLRRKVGDWGYGLFVPRGLAKNVTEESKLPTLTYAKVTADPTPFRWLESSLRTTLDVGLECASYHQAVNAVGTGRFAAVLPLPAARELPQAALFPVSAPSATRRSPLHLVARRSRFESNASFAASYQALHAALVVLLEESAALTA
jgi:DNA-binding transcriptional LysR family regulator